MVHAGDAEQVNLRAIANCRTDGGEHLKDLLVGQILWVRPHDLALTALVYIIVLLVWFTLAPRLGRVGFYTIHESPGLSPAARRRARAAGPRAVAMRSDHQRLLRAAGFRDITELDVTPAFAATAAAWLAETEPHAEELARLEPPGAFAQRQADRRSMLAARLCR